MFHSSDIIAHGTIWFSGSWYFYCRVPVTSCTNKAVFGLANGGTEPSTRVVTVLGKGWSEAQYVADASPFLTQPLQHMDILDRNPVCLRAWRSIERMTWQQGKARLQFHGLRSITRKAVSFTSESSSGETSIQMAVTVVATLVFPVEVNVVDHQTLLPDWGPCLATFSTCCVCWPGSGFPEYGCSKGSSPSGGAL